MIAAALTRSDNPSPEYLKMDFGSHAPATSLCLDMESCDNPLALGP